MPVEGNEALGTQISVNGQDVGGAGDITGPDDSYDWWDSTAHDAPDRTETGKPTVRRTGEVTFDCNVDTNDAGQVELLAAHEAIAAGNHDPDEFVITYPDGATCEFVGYVMRFSLPDAPVTEGLVAHCVIRPTGAITRTPAAS